MGWTTYTEAEATLGTRLARKLATGALPAYTDAAGRRWVWLQEGHAEGDVLWEVLAELARVREGLARLEAQVQAREREAAPAPAARPPAGRVVSLSTGAFRRLETLLEGDAREAA